MSDDLGSTDPARRLADLAYDLLNVAAAIRGQAQQTRRRVRRVDRLSRDHIGSDLEQIEFHVERLVALIRPLHDGINPENLAADDATLDEATWERGPAPGGRLPTDRRGRRA